MPVKRADPDTGAAGNVLEGHVRAPGREGVRGGRDQPLAVADRIGAGAAIQRRCSSSDRRLHVPSGDHQTLVAKRREPPYNTGGSVRFDHRTPRRFFVPPLPLFAPPGVRDPSAPPPRPRARHHPGGPVDGGSRCHDREHRAPQDRRRAALLAGEALVGHHRLHAGVRRLPAPRRASRRPARPRASSSRGSPSSPPPPSSAGSRRGAAGCSPPGRSRGSAVRWPRRRRSPC